MEISLPGSVQIPTIGDITIDGQALGNQALSKFKAHPQEYETPLTKLKTNFVRASHYCCNSDCIFSYKRPGKQANDSDPCSEDDEKYEMAEAEPTADETAEGNERDGAEDADGDACELY